MSLTTDPTDPNLGHGVDAEPVAQHDTYLVLSEGERARGFVRPVRRSYVHVGAPAPQYPLRDLDDDQRQRDHASAYVGYEEYPESESPALGRYWTRAQLDNVANGCGALTTMGVALAETYARSPSFYGSTYCVGCSMHKAVGEHGEFVWDGTDERVGT